MSVEAMAWAFRQKLPPKPKIVLLALADQTDETTGRVCYGKTDIKHLAAKSAVGERTLYRYLAALIRNGYMIRESGAAKGQESQFWLRLDRPGTPLGDWHWTVSADENTGDDEISEDIGEPQDVEGGSANLAEGETVENSLEDAQNGRGGLPQDGRPRLSGRHQDIKARAQDGQESGFSRKAQDLELEAAAIAKLAQKQNVQYFVIQGTRAWVAWIEHRRKTGQVASLPTCDGTGEHAGKRGWWLPSLFPPASEGGSELSAEDSRQLAKL